MKQLTPGRPSQSPEEQERLIEAVEQAYGSATYSELTEARDRRQLAVLSALNQADNTDNNEN